MIKGIFAVIILLFAVSGICELIHSLKVFSLSQKDGNFNYCVVWLKSGFALEQLMYVNEQRSWHGHRYCESVLAVDTELDESEHNLCLEFARNHDVILVSEDMLTHVLKQLS